MSASDNKKDGAAWGHDWLTLLAIGVVVYVSAKVLHEGVGHGLACILVGGKLRGVSSSWCDCDTAMISDWSKRAINASGTLVNLAAGAGFLIALRRGFFCTGASHYFAWLFSAVNLFMSGGYMMTDPLFRFGDWAAFIAGLTPSAVLRFGISAIGLFVSLGTFFLLRGPLEALLGRSPPVRKRQAFVLCWLPYFVVGGGVMTGAAFLNSLGAKYAFTSSLATLGGTFMLLWIPTSVVSSSAVSVDMKVARSRGWLTAGGVTLAFLLLAFGPGIAR